MPYKLFLQELDVVSLLIPAHRKYDGETSFCADRVESNQHALIWIVNTAQVADMETKILGKILLDLLKELIFVEVTEYIRKFERGIEICIL